MNTKTRVFRGRDEVPAGASSAHGDGGLRFSVGLQEAQLIFFFFFFQHVSVLNDDCVGQLSTFHHQSRCPGLS